MYDYMLKGSLGEYLLKEECELDWDLWYKIVVGLVEGLEYLYYDCKLFIIYCDIKLNNILLDDYYEVYVGDFGLVKFFDLVDMKFMLGVVGLYGYIVFGKYL